MILLNSSALVQTTLAAVMVIGGVSAKNSSEQLPIENKGVLNNVGMGLFMGGWLLAAYVLSQNKINILQYALPCMGVLISVMMMKEKKLMKKYLPFTIPESVTKYVVPGIFIASWIAIGYNVGDRFDGFMRYSGLIATALVVVSMMKVLPYQREHDNVDGPGSYMFAFAWAIIVFLNSNR
jgi:hypothetical protein